MGESKETAVKHWHITACCDGRTLCGSPDDDENSLGAVPLCDLLGLPRESDDDDQPDPESIKPVEPRLVCWECHDFLILLLGAAMHTYDGYVVGKQRKAGSLDEEELAHLLEE